MMAPAPLLLLLPLALFLPLVAASAGGPAQTQAHPQRLIIDTDMGFDVDDVGAVCLGNALHMNGKADLIAVVHDTGCHLGIGGVSAINHFYGHDNITLGAFKGSFGSDCNKHYEGTSGQNQYLSRVIGSMGGPVKDYSQVPLASVAYRRALANVPNGSVNIASIGMPTNLRDLLATKPDSISPLSGYDLVRAKVDTVVFMDGGYNFGCAAGNIGPSDDCYGSAHDALKNMPPEVSMVFSGKGENPDIYTGSGLQSHHPPNSPCREAYNDWCCNPNGKRGSSGRLSWDPITVMIAALGVDSVFEKLTNVGTQVTADEDGREHFFGSGTRNAQTDFTDYKTSPSNIRSAIDGYLNQVPGGGGAGGWRELSGHNCWGDRGTGMSHGASDLEKPASSAAPGSPMSLADCEKACDGMTGCTAITVEQAGNGLVNCFRKADVVAGECDQGTNFDTYLKPNASWRELAGYNCWGNRGTGRSHGAVDLENPASSAAPGSPMALGDCIKLCDKMVSCTAVTVGQAGNGLVNCFRKAEINAGECDQGTNFDTYLMQ